MNYKQNSIFVDNQIIILSYFISLVPVALVFSIFVADFIVSISATIFIFLIIKNKFKIIFDNNITKFAILFCFYLSIKSILANEETHSLLRSIFYIRYLLFSLLICYLYNFYPKFKKIFFRIMTLNLMFISIHAYLIHFLNFDLLSFNFDSISFKQNYSVLFSKEGLPESSNLTGFQTDYRISGIFYDESILGSYLQKILPIYLGMIFLLKKPKKYLIFFLFLFFLLPISGERSAFVLASFFIFLFVLTYQSSFKKKFYIGIIFLIGLSLIIGTNPNVKERIIGNTLKILTEKSSDQPDKKFNVNLFSRGHQGHFTSAYQIFKDNPFFGVGIKNFRYECKKDKYAGMYSCTTHPHNTYLQLLSETGIIGFLFVFIFFIYLLIKIIKIIFLNFRNKTFSSNQYKCFLIAVFINLWPLIPTGSFFNNWICISYFLSLGFLLSETYKINNIFK